MKPKKTGHLRPVLVVKAGLEPARRLKHKILNLACLPIPPLDQAAVAQLHNYSTLRHRLAYYQINLKLIKVTVC